MKKYLFKLLLTSCMVASLRADVLFNETFNYPDGLLTNVAQNIWYQHSSANADSFVKNHRLEVGMSRGADVNRKFESFTNTQTILYSAFTVNCTNLPAVANYFAH